MATCHSPSSNNYTNFLRISYKRSPIAHEENSPVATAAKTGVRVYAKENLTFEVFSFLNCLSTIDEKRNTRSNLQMTTGILQNEIGERSASS